MTYQYTNPKRESETYGLPDVEIWEDTIFDITCSCGVYGVHEGYATATDETYCPSCERVADKVENTTRTGWFYWFCLPGCLPDSTAFGPFETEDAAMEDARENAGVYDEGDEE